MTKTLKANVSFLGQLPEFSSTGQENMSDYRPVPSGDRGNAAYTDKGMLGSYRSHEGLFRDPSDVRHFTGYGADVADLQRGYQVPMIRDDPAYQLDNYKERSTLPMLPDEDEGGDPMSDDYAFRRRNERAQGFLTRPRIPTDR